MKAGLAKIDLPLALALLFFALCAALVIWAVGHIVPLAVAGQAYLLIILLVAFRHWPPMRRWIGRMPVVHRTVFLALIFGVIIGHFTLNSRTYFPFVAWEIFPFEREEDPMICREFLATTASGKSVRLLVEQLFPSIVQFNPPADKDADAMTHLVDAMATMYNRQHGSDPVRRVELCNIAIHLHPVNGEYKTCELLKQYDVSSDRSN